MIVLSFDSWVKARKMKKQFFTESQSFPCLLWQGDEYNGPDCKVLGGSGDGGGGGD